ncbi:MAG TPA: phosphatase PAP2-related protein [Puia sp.]|nr:phosphatase PAP2-related protein [Puia sp.]
MPLTTLIELRQEWQDAWQSPPFRRKVITGLLFVTVILSAFPIFFQTIEKRNGFALNDPLLRWLPAHNVSLALFIIIWALCLLAIYRAAKHPYIFLTFLWAYILLSVMRILSITLVPLNPPVGLIGLVDPIGNFFYGEKFVTKDLFFSGHTSTVFLLYLCLPGKKDKKIALAVTILVGFLLLVQHVHYTLDVLGAFLFAWIAYWVARRTVLRN